MTIIIMVPHATGQSCLNGFLSNTEVIEQGQACTDKNCTCELNNDDFITRLIPGMNFTCNGRIINWRAAGKLLTLSSNEDVDQTKLRIWRRVENCPGSFFSHNNLTITLGVCNNGQPANTTATNVHECQLANDSQVSVQPGDIVGLEIPRSTRRVFTPYFINTTAGPKSYDFLNSTVSVNISLNDSTITTTQAQLLLSLEVDMDVTTNNIERTLPFTESNDFTLITTEFSVLTDITTNNETVVNIVSFSGVIIAAGVVASLVLMAAVIVILFLALVCSVRKYRKLKREMMMNNRRSVGCNINEMILSNSTGRDHVTFNDSTGGDHVTSEIPMEENTAYGRRKRSDGYEYVVNELVYASIDECDQQLPQESLVSNTYMEILDN